MKKNKPHNLKYTKEFCKKEITKYDNKSDLKKYNRGVYEACVRNKWLKNFYPDIIYLTEIEFKKILYSNNIRLKEQYILFYEVNKNLNIPKYPRKIYKNFYWIDMLWLSFEEAREFAHSLNLNSEREWFEYCKSGDKPNNIPTNVRYVYRDKGYISCADFLNLNDWLPFEEARKFAHSLNLKGTKEWFEYCKSGDKPNNIPNYPNETYLNKGWKSWGNFLGDGYKKWLPFEEAREFAHSLNLKNIEKWFEYCKSGDKPNNIPKTPYDVYKNQWISWDDFLNLTSQLLFEEAREFVHSLNLNSEREWFEYCKSGDKPNNIPSYPYEQYKNKGWVSWSDFLNYKSRSIDNNSKHNQGWIYALISPIGEIYIGMSINIEQRFNNYKILKCKTQPKLYNSISEHGWENFEKHILEYLDYPFRRYELCELERNNIEKYDTFNNGLNSTKGG